MKQIVNVLLYRIFLFHETDSAIFIVETNLEDVLNYEERNT